MQGDDVWVLEMALDLDLSSKVRNDIVLDQLPLVDHFKGDDVLEFLVARQVDVTELASAYRSSDLEIVHAPG